MNYRVIKGGMGIKNHLGEVTFEETAGGTRILWRCRFDAKIPGTGPLLRLMITRVFRGLSTASRPASKRAALGARMHRG